MAAVARLNRIWQCNTISFTSKSWLYKSFVTSILLYGCGTWTLLVDYEKKKDLGFCNQVLEEPSPHLVLGAQDQLLGVGQDQLPRGSTGTSSGNSQETEICIVQTSQTTTASPKTSFRAPCRVGDIVAGRRNAGWTTSKSGHPSQCQNCSQGLLQKRLEEELC